MKKRILSAIILLSAVLTLFSTTALAAPKVSLKMGSSGGNVKILQKYLIANGYSLTADGKFGADTKNAVMKYQAAVGLKSDGVVGSATWNRLERVEKFITIAKTKIGNKYTSGGKGPNAFDCSGFVYWCLNKAGIRQSYMTSSSWQISKKYKRITDIDDLQRGDVISFKGHVGIYLGNNQMISALNKASGVCISTTNSFYRKNRFVCAFRIY